MFYKNQLISATLKKLRNADLKSRIKIAYCVGYKNRHWNPKNIGYETQVH